MSRTVTSAVVDLRSSISVLTDARAAWRDSAMKAHIAALCMRCACAVHALCMRCACACAWHTCACALLCMPCGCARAVHVMCMRCASTIVQPDLPRNRGINKCQSTMWTTKTRAHELFSGALTVKTASAHAYSASDQVVSAFGPLF